MLKKDLDFLKNEFTSFFKSLRRIFVYKKEDKKDFTGKILVLGGYGFGNCGDEAQCNATLKILTERYSSKYQIVNLTPNVIYSKSEHPDFTHDFASRTMFFNKNRDCNCYDFKTSQVKRLFFFIKSVLILLNAFLVRADFATFLINARVAKFLYELKEGSLLYFCGGGYLTGDTESRLWDGFLLCILARIFKLPVVMSGQTIGIWNNTFNKMVAEFAFKKVNVITVRDEGYSLADLEAIGLKGDNYFETHDDALFCDKSENKQTNLNSYITINFHYWGMPKQEKAKYIEKINLIIDSVLKQTDYKILFIPMKKTDKSSFDDYIRKYPSERIFYFDYDYNFKKVRRVIADSKICITMKHHPIIFAMGENVPVISLVFSKYYLHKNEGALAQYGQKKYSINLENDDFLSQFNYLFNEVEKNRNQIISDIILHKQVLIERKERFLKLVDDILGL